MSNPWGELYGVKPVKLTRELFNGKFGCKDEDDVRNIFHKRYHTSKEKTDLLIEIYKYQNGILGTPDTDSIGMYIGIPFCPTRCLYCSFTSNQKPKEEIERYLVALKKEIEYAGKRMRETGLYPESIYIGGGTPTTLDEFQLNQLLQHILQYIDLCKLKEFTVEAGRPDTITREKLKALKENGVSRISINPQSMKERTLELIGRSHKPEDIRKAFKISDEEGFDIVNCDLIAGLPEETPFDFENSLKEIISFNPKNITVHTLALKRASRLIEIDDNYHEKEKDIVPVMIDKANEILRANGYRPYYLYRLKRQAGSLENVGWQKDDTPGIYNIRIMDEQQSILALGAGGISKIYFPEENRLERIPNVSNYEVYIDRLDEMLNRKEENFFKEAKNANQHS